MDAHDFWTIIHVFTLVYWLGADLGVFYTSRQVIRSDYTPETRAALMKVLVWLDMLPRYMLLITLPVGLQLAGGLGLTAITGGWMVLVWLGAILWIALVSELGRREGKPVVALLQRIDVGLRLILIAALAVAVIASIANGAPFSENWLILKVALFAGAVSCGVGIRLTFKPFGPAFAKMMRDGSTPEVEAAMKRSLGRASPFVLGIWGVLVVTAIVGISQPGF